MASIVPNKLSGWQTVQSIWMVALSTPFDWKVDKGKSFNYLLVACLYVWCYSAAHLQTRFLVLEILLKTIEVIHEDLLILKPLKR